MQAFVHAKQVIICQMQQLGNAPSAYLFAICVLMGLLIVKHVPQQLSGYKMVNAFLIVLLDIKLFLHH